MYGWAALAMWFRFLYFFKIFKSTSFYIRMIFKVITDLGQFFFIFLIVIFAFSNFFFIYGKNFHPEEGDERSGYYGNNSDQVVYVILHCYRTAIGDVAADDYDGGLFIFLILLTLLVTIIMLNLLVTIVGETYGTM